DDRRRSELSDRVVEGYDALPVRLRRRRRSSVARGDRRLQRVGTQGAPEPLGALERRQAAPDEQTIPARSILIEQEDGLAGRPNASAETRGLDLHERDDALDFRLGRDELGQDAAQTERLLTKRRSDPVFTRRGGIPLIEDQIDHLKDG